ncbi:SURP and G-patch domain-containing protein 2 [Sylvia atricapilla]|uniref:SURP and G-patch domain-containing protein 2 n=1 Tax=Sylvia atricapilla TaxID=48155 RepID=UPI003399BB40
MASRRISRETFEAVVQDKVKRYRMERSDAAGDSIHHFKAHPRPPPRPRYSDGRFPHANSQHQEWNQEPREDYPGENYPGENYPGENYPGENFPGPSYRPASPLLRKENYFHGQFARREREFGRDFGRPAPQNREFGRGAAPNREYGHHPAPPSREYGQQEREYGQQEREYGRDYGHEQDYGPTQDCWEAHEPEFGSSDVLGDFRSPGLMEEEYGGVENQEYEGEFGDGEFRPPLRRGGGVGRGRVLRGKRLTRGVAKPKIFKGDLKSPLKKWNMKKPQPGLDPKALDQALDVANQRPVPLQQQQQQHQQHPKLPPHPLAAQRPILRLPKPTQTFRNLSFDLVDKSDIFSTFGVEIIKWAGFHAIKNDAEFSRLFGALFELETETCAKMLASFKCSLRPEHRDYCFFTIKSLQHAALKTPKVDNEFLNMLLDKGAVKTKNCFFEIIKPFDKYIMRLQDRLLKGVTPLLMACNAYELSVKTNGFGNARDMANAFETTVSLCRKSLALLGQTFALASVFRQEKILEAVGLQEMAPAPTAFPNFDDSTLFGREYIENLKAWLEKSGYPIQMKRTEVEGTEQSKGASPDSKAPQRADRSAAATIERLVSDIVAGTLSAQDRKAQEQSPEYWFLSDEASLEYKYFQLKLSEAQRRNPNPTPESLRAFLYAKRAASIKKKLFRRKQKPKIPVFLRASKGKKTKKTTPSSRTKQSDKGKKEKNPPGLTKKEISEPKSELLGQELSPLGVTCVPQGGPSAEGDVGAPGELSAAPAEVCSAQFGDVDAKTLETAEKLARLVAQVGPDIEQFSIDNSADTPDLWFLQDQNSSAFKFYRMKVHELCPSITFNPGAAGPPKPPGTTLDSAEDEEAEDEEEEDEEDEEEETEFETSQPLGNDVDDEDDDDDEDEAAGRRVANLEEDLLPRAGEEEEEEEEEEEMAGGEVQSPSDGAVPNLSTQAPPAPAPGAPFPRKRISSKSLKVGMIPASKRICLIEEPKVHEPVRIAYDRPRGCPVTKKKKKPKDLEFSQKRLSPRNVGFQMLQRMGWQEGHGLGSRGRGIREPVHLGTTSAGEGLGVEEENQEDAFDVFRQRMIQMYRQKRANK